MGIQFGYVVCIYMVMGGMGPTRGLCRPESGVNLFLVTTLNLCICIQCRLFFF